MTILYRVDEDSVLVEVGDVPLDRLNEWHTVYVGNTRWKLAHPLFCELTDCEFDNRAEAWERAPGDVGVYRWGPKLSDWVTVEETT